MRKVIAVLVVAMGVFSCGGEKAEEHDVSADELAQREQELAISELFQTPALIVQLSTFNPPGWTFASAGRLSGRPLATCQSDYRSGVCRVSLGCNNNGVTPVSFPSLNLSSGSTSYDLDDATPFVFDFNPAGTPIQPGDTVRISSAGDARIGAFAFNSVMPSELTSSTPAMGFGPDTAIDVTRGNGLNLAWAGGNRFVEVEVMSATEKVIVQDDGARGLEVVDFSTVRCLFPAAAHQGRIPASLLGLLPASNSIGEDFRNTANVGDIGHINSLIMTSQTNTLKLVGPKLVEFVGVSHQRQNNSVNLH